MKKKKLSEFLSFTNCNQKSFLLISKILQKSTNMQLILKIKEKKEN